MLKLYSLKSVILKKGVVHTLLFFFLAQTVNSQNIESKVITYNVLVGGLSGGIGALINKKKDEKWPKTFAKGFLVGCGGGALVYSGKKINYFISQKHELGYGWVSRIVFSAGNSIVENAAANRPFWSQWHYDVGFVRMEFKTMGKFGIVPRFMPSAFGGIMFMAIHGKVDAHTSLRSGTLTFHTDKIRYATNLVGSTTSNGFLLVDTLISGSRFYDVYAHEMVHAFQFQELSGVNTFFNPLTNTWKERSPAFKKYGKYIYPDLNYELMLINYFIIQRGPKGHVYCGNYLENEAEFLSVGRSACFP